MDSLTKQRVYLSQLYCEREELFRNGWSKQVQDRFGILSEEIPNLERILAKADCRQFAEYFEIGETITKSSKHSVLVTSDSRAVLFYDGIYRNKKPTDEVVELKFDCVYAIEFGGPGDELTRHHPFFGHGLADVGCYEIKNSEWKLKYQSIEQLHALYDKGLWEAFRHFFFRFKNGDVHVLAKSVFSRLVPGDLQVFHNLMRRDKIGESILVR